MLQMAYQPLFTARLISTTVLIKSTPVTPLLSRNAYLAQIESYSLKLSARTLMANATMTPGLQLQLARPIHIPSKMQ